MFYRARTNPRKGYNFEKKFARDAYERILVILKFFFSIYDDAAEIFCVTVRAEHTVHAIQYTSQYYNLSSAAEVFQLLGI